MKTICNKCGKLKEHHAKSLCKNCYYKKWHKEHPERIKKLQRESLKKYYAEYLEKLMIMKTTDLAYIAGFIDGEGCMAIEKYYPNKGCPCCYRFKLRIANTDYGIIQWLKINFGGNIRIIKPQNNRHKTAWEWYLSGKRIAYCLKFLLPYLRIKKSHTELGINFQARKKGVGYHLTKEERAVEKSDWILMKSMNKRGP